LKAPKIKKNTLKFLSKLNQIKQIKEREREKKLLYLQLVKIKIKKENFLMIKIYMKSFY